MLTLVSCMSPILTCPMNLQQHGGEDTYTLHRIVLFIVKDFNKYCVSIARPYNALTSMGQWGAAATPTPIPTPQHSTPKRPKTFQHPNTLQPTAPNLRYSQHSAIS